MAAWFAAAVHGASLPAGTIVVDVPNKDQTYASTSEVLDSVGKNSNNCQLDQDPALAVLRYFADNGDQSSRGDQRGGLGIKSQGQDCAFAGPGQGWKAVPGPAIPAAAKIVGWEVRVILTDDAIFTISPLDDDGIPIQLTDTAGNPLWHDAAETDPVTAFKIFSGKSGCFPEGTSGVPRTLAGPWEYNHAPCTAQSKPNSDFAEVLGQQRAGLIMFDGVAVPDGWRQTHFGVETGHMGVTNMEFDLAIAARDDTLTCDGGIGDTTITEVEEFDGIFEVGDGVQCRRLPNRDGSQCIGVPYVLNASCTGPDCELEFLHGDQEGVLRADFAFVCEVWWPARPGNFTAGAPDEPFLDRTEVFWGGLPPAPSAQGDDLNWCQGVTPLFSDATKCGTGLAYKLSGPGPVDGGTVSDDMALCSLLGTYDDVLLLAPGAAPAPQDQCDEGVNPDCPVGRQLACLMQERIVAEEDPDVQDATASPDQTGPGRIDGAADPEYRKYELLFFEGDIKLRQFSTGG